MGTYSARPWSRDHRDQRCWTAQRGPVDPASVPTHPSPTTSRPRAVRGHREGRLGRSPFGPTAPAVLLAVGFGIAVVVWSVAGERLAVAVIPLLFETKAESSFDKIACVVCSPELQRERLRAREWSDDQISNRISAQMAVGEKIKRADHVIWTDGTIDAHAAQWDDLLSSWDVVD